MNKCTKCGAEYENGETTCSKCGAETVPVPPDAARACSSCGATLPQGSKFCLNCGTKVVAPAAPEPEKAPEPEPAPEPEAAPEAEPQPEPADEPAQPRGRTCKVCGAPALDDDEFCGECGARIEPEPAKAQETQTKNGYAYARPLKKAKKKNRWIWFAAGGAAIVIAAVLLLFVFHVFPAGNAEENKLMPIFYSDHDSAYMAVNESVVELEGAMFAQDSESELNAITNPGNDYLYYLADAEDGEGTLMRVKLDDPEADPLICAEYVCNARVSADGESVLMLREMEDNTGELYRWKDGEEESIAKSVPESQFGLSPDGTVACYFTVVIDNEDTETKALNVRIGTGDPEEIYTLEENESILRVHVFDEGVVIFQIRDSEEKTDRICRYSDGKLETIGDGRLMAVFNSSELLYKEDTSLYYLPSDGETERITKNYFHISVSDSDLWSYTSLFIDTNELPEKRFVLFELTDDEIILSECVPGESLTEIVEIDQFKDDYSENQYLLLYYADGLFGRVSESYQWLIYFDGDEWKLANKTEGEWDNDIDLPEDAQTGKFDASEQYLYYKSDEKLMRYDLFLEEAERVLRDIASFGIIEGRIFAITNDDELYSITADDEKRIAKEVAGFNKVGGDKFYVLLSANEYDIDYYESADAEGINIVFDADRVLTLSSSGAIDYYPESGDKETDDKSADSGASDVTEEPAQSSILPLTYTAYGNKYVIKEFTYGKDTDGKTTVTVTGTGFGSLPIRNGSFVMPVRCSIISDGKEYSYTSAKISSTKVTYVFNTTAEPDSIVFYPGDNTDNRTKIDVRDY